MPHLASILESHLDVRLVVHSSWIERFGIEELREFLEPLGSRLVGSVGAGSKPAAIQAFIGAHRDIHYWLVVGDEQSGFPADFPGLLLVCEPATGLSNVETKRRLSQRLERTAPRSERQP